MSHRTTPPLLAAALVSTAALAAGAGSAPAPAAVAVSSSCAPGPAPVALADLSPTQLADVARTLGTTEHALRRRMDRDPTLTLDGCARLPGSAVPDAHD